MIPAALKATAHIRGLPSPPQYKLDYYEAMDLFNWSPEHKNRKLSHVSRVVLPPLHLGQYLLCFNKSKAPCGFISWAYLSESVAKKFANGKYTLQRTDWSSGSELWIIHFICRERKKIKAMIQLARENLGADEAYFIRHDQPGWVRGRNGRRVTKYV